MPPSAKRLPRRRQARSGELNLEKVCEERIDAVTAEPLVAGHFVEVLSPDKTLKLFYNTSTLIRIAMDKGQFMQPPHFRETMEVTMQRKIEELEGKTFHFEAQDHFFPARLAGEDEAGLEGAGMAVHHRHVYFDQIVEEFYLLNPAELYVCSICYEHYVQTRFIPDEARNGRRVDYLTQEGEDSAIPVLDPLDVLSHAAQPPDAAFSHDDDSNDDAGENRLELECPLVHMAFRYAAPWKKHMKRHHAVTDVRGEDYTVRARLCNFYSHYNQLQTQRYEKRVKKYGTAKPTPALTQQRYWLYSAGYNRLRYNRLVETVEACHGDPRTYEVSAFPGEDIAVDLNPAADDNDSDFICDDDSASDDTYFPHYSPSEEDDEYEAVPSKAGHRVAGRKRRREDDDSADSPTTSSSSSSATDASVEEASNDDERDSSDEEGFVSSQIQTQHHLFKRGLLAERDCYYERLSADDRRFLDTQSRRASATPSSLYDPKMVTLTGSGLAGSPSSLGQSLDLDDWANIGEKLQSPHTLQQGSKQAHGQPQSSPSSAPQFRTSAMLLDDE